MKLCTENGTKKQKAEKGIEERGSLTWRRHCSVSHIGSPCSCWAHQLLWSHNKSKVGSIHWQKPEGPGSRWRGIWGDQATFSPKRSAEVLNGSWLWTGIWDATNLKCWISQTVLLQSELGATFPILPLDENHYTERKKYTRWKVERAFIKLYPLSSLLHPNKVTKVSIKHSFIQQILCMTPFFPYPNNTWC